MAFCRKCGAEIDDEAVVCPKCGVPQSSYQVQAKKEGMNRLSIVAMISMVLFMVVSFLPFVYTVSYWKADKPGVGIYSHKWDKGVNVFYNQPLFGVLIVVFALTTVILLIFVERINNSRIISLISLVATAVCFIISSILKFAEKIPNGKPGGLATSGYYGYFKISPGTGFFICCIALVISLAFIIKIIVDANKET